MRKTLFIVWCLASLFAPKGLGAVTVPDSLTSDEGRTPSCLQAVQAEERRLETILQNLKKQEMDLKQSQPALPAKEDAMDVVYIGLSLGLVALSIGLIVLCEKL